MSPSSSTETMEEEHRRKEDNILVQIVLSSLFILLNSTYGMYGPGFLFKGTAFLICVIFAFTGAFCAVLIGDKTQLATFHKIYSIMSMAFMSLALLIFFFDLLLYISRLLAQTLHHLPSVPNPSENALTSIVTATVFLVY
ncbi:hypothetical protein Pint_25942 [Pistacia integerrima]|uniref:Uncharacterized protein n=1 Tax=Pistacia integerrima TaxID=434235 RepID=A0ACC0YH24_9ROSI|nr:hypothetical protein Pint_25942 [Pistacia integerrima]